MILSRRRDTLYISMLTKYHTDVIVSRLCNSITQTWFGPNWYLQSWDFLGALQKYFKINISKCRHWLSLKSTCGFCLFKRVGVLTGGDSASVKFYAVPTVYKIRLTHQAEKSLNKNLLKKKKIIGQLRKWFLGDKYLCGVHHFLGQNNKLLLIDISTEERIRSESWLHA